MSAAQGLNAYSIHAQATPYTETADYLAKYNTRPASQTSSTATTTPGVVSAPAAAAPVARTPTPQETANTKYMPQLDAQMAKDPSNGYADQLKTLMTGQFSPNDPSYAWRFQQGQQAVERSAAAKGLLQSGNAAIELQQYGQGMASQEYGAQFNRTLSALGASENAFQSSYNRLAELAGMTTGMQANSQNTNYNYSNLAERAQNNQQQIGLGYASLAQKTAASQAEIGVQQGQLLIQNRAMNLQEQQYQDQKRTGDNRDAAFKEILASRGVGSNGDDVGGYVMGNVAGNPFVSVGPAESQEQQSRGRKKAGDNRDVSAEPDEPAEPTELPDTMSGYY